VTSGLRFLHENHLVHGALRPVRKDALLLIRINVRQSHVLIDDNGVARLATGGRNSIMAVPDTSIADHVQSGGDVDGYRYSAPELHQPEGHGTDETIITKESDVYGMGMIVFEASSRRPVSPSGWVKSHSNFLGLDRGQTIL